MLFSSVSKRFRASFTVKHLLVLTFALTSLLITPLFFSNDLCGLTSSRSFLKSSSYEYSVHVNKNLSENTYADYSGKMVFMCDKSGSKVIASDVLMQTGSRSTECDLLFKYNLNLKHNEVMISRNLLKQYSLHINDAIFSKHKISNSIMTYTIVSEFPELFGAFAFEQSLSTGLIVAGMDQSYLDNYTTSFYYFYDTENNIIQSENASISGDITNKKMVIASIKMGEAWRMLLISAISLIVVIACSVMLSLFNINVYKRKSMTGCQSVFSYVLTDFLLYFLSISLPLVVLLVLLQKLIGFYLLIPVIVVSLCGLVFYLTTVINYKKAIRG